MPREFKITKEVLLEATPEQVWESIATEAGLAAWFQPAPVSPASELGRGRGPGVLRDRRGLARPARRARHRRAARAGLGRAH